ncbi:hypothetical protein BC629DRAFT_667838 [Irpex lacteus]|nr:hypothetical protein BC629DRAFT_667838 [Irpex lacteus]
MRLNFDILFIVMNHFWSTQDVQSLMMTCSTLYNYGIPRLFNARLRVTSANCLLLRLHDEGPLTLQVHHAYAIPLLEATRTTWNSNDHDSATRHGAGRGDHRRYVSRHRSQDSRSRGRATVARGCANQRFLHGCRQDLQRCTRPNKTCGCGTIGNDGGPADIIEVFSGVKATLERMIVGIASWEEHRDIVYPKLSWLVIWNPYECTVRGLITSFPNLRQLHVGIRPEEGVDNPLNWIDDFAAERHENIEDQTLRGSWTRLDTLRGDVDILYAMGLFVALTTCICA